MVNIRFGFREGLFLISSAAFANAQGQLGGSQSACDPTSQSHVYIGCYDVTDQDLNGASLAEGADYYPFQVAPYPNVYTSSNSNFQDPNSYVAAGPLPGYALAYAEYEFDNRYGAFQKSFLSIP